MMLTRAQPHRRAVTMSIAENEKMLIGEAAVTRQIRRAFPH